MTKRQQSREDIGFGLRWRYPVAALTSYLSQQRSQKRPTPLSGSSKRVPIASPLLTSEKLPRLCCGSGSHLQLPEPLPATRALVAPASGPAAWATDSRARPRSKRRQGGRAVEVRSAHVLGPAEDIAPRVSSPMAVAKEANTGSSPSSTEKPHHAAAAVRRLAAWLLTT